MKLLVMLLIPLAFCSNIFASEQSCNQDMTREPYCVNIVTAAAFCSKIGKNQDSLLAAKKCYIDMSKAIGADGARQACLAISVKSADPAQNKSHCGERPTGRSASKSAT